MRKDSAFIQALWRAAATVAYVTLVAVFMFNASRWFGEKDDFLAPVFALLLFVISATVTGLLVLGRPLALYLGGAKKVAFAFLSATLGWPAVFLVAVGAIMALT